VPTRSIPLILALLASAAHAPDSTKAVLPWSAPTSWDVEIASESEPGPRLVISGRLFGLDSLPVANAKLYAYHADGEGRYALSPHSFNRTFDSTHVYQCRKDLWLASMPEVDSSYVALMDSLRHEVESGRR